MRLLRLQLQNFKGAREVTVNFAGQSMDIFGDNRTGKTTLFDAYCWLLFGKDSKNQADFAIKTLDESGEAKHNLNHSVEATITHGTTPMTLKKVYAETYTRKKGDASETFTGHETSMFIDGVPTKKKEWDAFIAQTFGDEMTFKLLSNPMHFNENMHWTDRRKILVSAFGGVSDAEVILADPELKDLPAILGTRTIENHRKVIAARRTEINDELKVIPARIDEANRSLPVINEQLLPDLSENLHAVKTLVKEKMMEILRIENGTEISEKRRAIVEIEGKIQVGKNLHDDKQNQAKNVLRVKWMDAAQLARTKEADIQMLAAQAKKHQTAISELEAELNAKRQQWKEQDAATFVPSGIPDSCPACGQALPADKVHEAMVQAEAEFNDSKARRIAEIDRQGKAVKAKLSECWEAADKTAVEKQSAEAELEELQKQAAIAKEAFESAGTGTEYIPDPELVAKRDALQKEIADLQAGSNEIAYKTKIELQQLQAKNQELEAVAAAVEQRKLTQVRIAELLKSEKDLSAEFEKLGREQYMTDRFIRARVGLLEQTINSRFRIVKFKLFETQTNGGVNECCEATVGGVPFGSGLNNAARINAGLDIINTLAAHFGFAPPVWVDNAEAVTDLLPIDSQTIRLVVSAQDKSLRMEPV